MNFVHLLIWNTENTVHLLWCSCQKCTTDSNHEEISGKPKLKIIYNIIALYSSKFQCHKRQKDLRNCPRLKEVEEIWQLKKHLTLGWILHQKKKKSVFTLKEIKLYCILMNDLVLTVILYIIGSEYTERENEWRWKRA